MNFDKRDPILFGNQIPLASFFPYKNGSVLKNLNHSLFYYEQNDPDRLQDKGIDYHHNQENNHIDYLYNHKNQGLL